ncbi:MAG TPA: gephyrin-like molybdotransferase Glp [Candidatus Sulfotelmatobacter sp.]|nr:gephyrin-like molybdotransferase Glp [Candidatus Sulfotelmatobacter sp.]
MAQLSDDCFAFGGRLMTTAEARALLDARVTPVVETETVPLGATLGRILAADLAAPIAVPPHANSAVDGYAVHFDDLASDVDTRLRIVGRVAAGHPSPRAPARGEALRIFTGAPMPSGPDTVLMQEDCRVEADTVVIRPGIKRGANFRAAGEDVAAGAVALRAGHRLRPQDLGLAASLGLNTLVVRRRLKVALFSTGDELTEPGQALRPGAIYDSNRYTLAALLRVTGIEIDDLGILPDRLPAIRAALADAAGRHDAILTSGGMSTGEEDHVKAAVEAIGALHFWRLAIKPGRPVALGQIGRVPFVGLPGNPVAVMVTYLRIARPLLLKLAGAADVEPTLYRVRAGFGYRKKKERREYVRAWLEAGADGAPVARRFPRDGAGILSSMVEADGLVELPEELTTLEPGAAVDYLPFSEVYA